MVAGAEGAPGLEETLANADGVPRLDAKVGLKTEGLLAIGAFPPEVAPRPVERVIPNERFAPR